MQSSRARSPLRPPQVWVLLLCGGIVVGLTAGMRQVTGLYVPPVRLALDIGIEPFSTALAIANLSWGVSAIGAGAMASGIGTFVVLPYLHLFMEAFGWRGSILAVIATLGAGLPLVWLLIIQDQGAPEVSQRPQPLKEALAEAFGLSSYWLLMAAFFICGFHVAFYAVHLPAYAASLGFGSWVGVASLAAVGAANILGTYLAGQSARYVQQRRTLSAIYLGRSFVFLGFLFLPLDSVILIVLSALLGFFWLATMPLTNSLVAVFFGPVWLSTLSGLVFLAHQIGAFFGVWLAGVLFDATRSYDVMWWVSAALGGIAAALAWPIREEPVARLREVGT